MKHPDYMSMQGGVGLETFGYTFPLLAVAS